MQMRWAAGLMAGIPPSVAGLFCRSISPLVVPILRRGVDAWLENLQAKGIPTAGPSPSRRSVIANHLLLHYESLAMLGGRQFSVRVEGEEHLEGALSAGRGVLIATAHLGNYHLAAAEVHARTGRTIHSVAGTQLLSAWTEDLRSSYRKIGLRFHDSSESVPTLTRALRSNEIVALHLDGDQHAGKGTASRGIALLSRRTGAPILPAISTRTAPGRIALRFLPVLSPGDRTPRYTEIESILVDAVRERPDQWVLFRPLWRTA